MKGLNCIIILIATVVSPAIKGQRSEPLSFIEPEVMVGRVVPNYPDHPESNFRNAFFLNIGSFSNNLDEHWAHYYNQPSAGISLSYANLGNKEVLGNEISIIPYLEINTSRKKESDWYFKFGLGTSYFTKFYDAETNIENEVIGSRFTWTFRLYLYRSILRTKQIDIKAGGGYLHSSNGHTQLPNFGLNSATLSLSARLYSRALNQNTQDRNLDFKADKTKQYFIKARLGYGIHEYGGTRRPVGGPKKGVYTCMITGGIIFRQHIKVRTGFTYRLYQHYLDDIEENAYPQYSNNPKWSASNLYFLLGAEFLIGHVGMDIEGGINIHKPFYDKFYEKYESGSDLTYWLKKTFPTRLGINYYLINTNKKPRHNISIGAHINSNFGQADFSELSVGYTHMIR